ncbi:unnamed protein product, partial [Prorocentrum cordatum]
NLFVTTAMPSASEMLAAAASAGGAATASADDRKRFRGADGGPPVRAAAQADRFERLLRFCLYRSSSLETALCASSLVFVLRETTIKAGTETAKGKWKENRPVVEESMHAQRNYPSHPLGEERVFLFMTVLEHAEKWYDADTQALITKVEQIPTKLLNSSIAAFQPRYPTAKEGRAWVFDLQLHTLMHDDVKLLALQFLAHKPVAELGIELHRKRQDGLEKALWTDLKEIQQARMARPCRDTCGHQGGTIFCGQCSPLVLGDGLL